MPSPPKRGAPPPVRRIKAAPAVNVTTLAVIWGALSAIVSLPLLLLDIPVRYAMSAAWLTTILIGLSPVAAWLWQLFRYGRFGSQIENSSVGIAFIQGALLAALILEASERFYGNVDAWWYIGIISGAGLFFAPVAKQLAGRRLWNGLRQSRPATHIAAPAAPPYPLPFTLTIGAASGYLASVRHGAGVEREQHIALDLQSACTNIIIFGGIGSGKTTRAINPLMFDAMRQDCGLLIFDIKTDFIREVAYTATHAGRQVRVIGDGGLPFNLLEGLTPEVAASFLKSAFLVAEGRSTSNHAFWVDGAVELCRNALGLLQPFPERYTLPELHRFIFDLEIQTEVLELIEDLMAEDQIDQASLRVIEANRYYFEKIWAPKEEKEKSYIQSTCAQVLSPFTNPALIDAFCTVRPAAEQAHFEDLVNSGVAYLVELPMTRYGKEGARIAYLFLKLRFMQMMRERRMRREWNQVRPVVFLCDEYQAIVDPVSDNDFWDKSRSSRTIGIISMQGYSSLVEAVGDEKAAATIAQNFRQILCFRTEDQPTIERLSYLLGQVDIPVATHSSGQGTSSGGRSTSKNSNTGESISWQRQSVINPQLFRQLGPDQALAILNIGGQAFDDVVTCRRLFVPDEWGVR